MGDVKVHAYIRVTDNWRTQIKLEKDVARKTDTAVKKMAESIRDDIKKSWSGFYPPSSDRGQPPAVRTGNLNDSVKVEDQGRSALGQFASGDNSKSWFIQIDTSGHPDGRNQQYAMALEDPDYLNRPFLEPALKRAEGRFDEFFRREGVFRV